MSSVESIKDGVLKQLGNQIKALQLRQVESSDDKSHAVITSNNIHLKCLFDVLDHILLYGLKHPNNGYWNFVCEFTHPEVQKQVNGHQDVHSVYDKGRLWIYLALLDSLLGSYFRMFYENQKLPSNFYNRNAFVRDKERLAVIFTLVAGLDVIQLSSELDLSFLGFRDFGLTNVLEQNPKANKRTNANNAIPMAPFSSPKELTNGNSGHVVENLASDESTVNENINQDSDQKEESTERTETQDKIDPVCDTDGGNCSKVSTTEESYLDSAEWLLIKSPQMDAKQRTQSPYDELSNDGDSFDEFCHNNDQKSVDSTELINDSTISLVEADEEPVSPLAEGGSTSLSEVPSMSEYEGIVLAGLPRRPGLSQTLASLVDAPIKKTVLDELALNVFVDQSEVFHRIVRVFTGFKYGLLHGLNLLLTDKAMYFLRQAPNGSFTCESVVLFQDVKQIEIGLNCQSLAFFSKGDTVCLSTGNEVLTRSLIAEISSLVVKELSSASHLTRLVTSAAVQGETCIKKWLHQERDLQTLNTEVLCFSLVHWLCFSGPGGELDIIPFQVIKEGCVECRSRYLGMVSHWEMNYLVLTPKALYQYAEQGDKNAKFVYNLDMNCGGCRRVSDQDKKFAFEIISDDGSTVVTLSSSTEDQASDWILKLCQAVAGSTDFLLTTLSPASRALPCCLVATKQNVVTFHAHNNNEYRFLSSFLVQDITKILVDNEVRQYCILKFESDHEGMWYFSFTTEYELSKFEQAIAEAWKEVLQADLQFYIIGEGPCRQRARDMCRYTQAVLGDS